MDWHYDRRSPACSPARPRAARCCARARATPRSSRPRSPTTHRRGDRARGELDGAASRRARSLADDRRRTPRARRRPDRGHRRVHDPARDRAARRRARHVRRAPPNRPSAFADPAIIFAGTAALDRLLGQATRATDGPRAGLERWGNDNPTGIAHDHVGVVGTGEMTIANFRGDATGTNGPDDETFQLDPIPASRS